MKKIICILGIVFPGLATKALAQQMKIPRIVDLSPERSILKPSHEEIRKLSLYESCSDEERVSFLKKLILNSKVERSSTLNDLLLKTNLEDILREPIEIQKDAIIELIRKGGLEWGKVIDPTEHIGSA
ncbi:MAG: hypothetical protein K2P81_16190 [Bacteriovoracaceae bacterium]|nr:hypothetical protein [Bacteriovoracaceae bacterium]